MSAITGIYRLDGQDAAREEIERMTQVLSHRGHDDSGVWCEGAVGLGHRMMWTTPESLHEKLPRADKSDDFVITADARIDNRDELRPLLGLSADAEVSDSEFILRAHGKWGEACTEHLIGDFAFALWDKKQEKLFCARDHFGVKPFYYHHAPGKYFAFATEIKALWELPDTPRELNETNVADFLIGLDGDRVSTYFSDIFRLAPAHNLIVQGAADLRTNRYWKLDAKRVTRLKSNQEYAERLRVLFTEAVRCRMRSAFPVGAMLSGGLDSSSIACVARDIRRDEPQLDGAANSAELPTFSAIFERHPQCDERPYINKTLAQGGFEPHYLLADAMSPLADLEEVLEHSEEVFQTFNTHIPWGIGGLAQKRGVRVLLDGYDGDTVVSHGTGLFYELANKGKWISLAHELKGYTQRVSKQSWRAALRAWMWRYAVAPKLEAIKKPLKRLRRRKVELHNEARPAWGATLNPLFVERLDLVKRQAAFHWPSPKTEREDHLRQLEWAITPTTLEMSDRLAAPFDVEMRYPFWDIRLAEYCLSLPPQQKLHDGYIRMVMRRAMAKVLPQEVCWRGDKSNLYPAFEDGIRRFEHARIAAVFAGRAENIEPYVDLEALRQVHERYEAKTASPADLVTLCRAVVLSAWLERTRLTRGT